MSLAEPFQVSLPFNFVVVATTIVILSVCAILFYHLTKNLLFIDKKEPIIEKEFEGIKYWERKEKVMFK